MSTAACIAIIWVTSSIIMTGIVYPLLYKVNRSFRSFIDDCDQIGMWAVFTAVFPPIMIVAVIVCAAKPALDLYGKWFKLVTRTDYDE